MHTEPQQPAVNPTRGASSNRLRLFYGGLVLIIVLGVSGLIAMESSRGTTVTPANSTNLVTVAVVKTVRADLFSELTIPAEFRPFAEVDLHAKVSGYVDKLNVDFGDKVKAGQLLATLEVPELQDQLHSALAGLAKAEADYTNAHLNRQRLETVNRAHTNLVAQQEIDAVTAKDGSAAAAIAAAKADVERYETLVKYTKISAPFDGVITKRYADPGTLIQAGTASDTQSLPVVRLSNNYKLRLDFDVSAAHVKDVHIGDQVQVKVDSLDDRVFTGTISRFTQKVDDRTRTMITEIEVPNSKLELVPGMYATVVLKLDPRPQALAIPIGAITSEKKPTVYVVDANQQLEERPVTLGLETPTQYEILDGLKEGDLVVIGSRAQTHAGQKVDYKITELASGQ